MDYHRLSRFYIPVAMLHELGSLGPQSWPAVGSPDTCVISGVLIPPQVSHTTTKKRAVLHSDGIDKQKTWTFSAKLI